MSKSDSHNQDRGAYKVTVTVGSLTIIVGMGLWAGQTELASASAGAIIGYLAKMNSG